MSRRPQRDRLGRLLLAGLASLLLTCGPDPPRSPLPGPTVEYSGCWSLSFPGPVCTPYPEPDNHLKLWVRTEGAAVEIRAGERLLKADGEAAPGGRRFHLPIPPGHSPLTVRLRQPDGTLSAPWSLALAVPEVPAWVAEIDGLHREGRTREALDRLTEIRKRALRKEQGLLLHSLAILAQREGQEEAAVAALEEGVLVNRAAGRLSGVGGEVETATMLSWIHRDHMRLADARRVLEELRIPGEAPADARYLVAYQQGLLADRVGDYRSALEHLREAVLLAERVGMHRYRWAAELVLARALQGLGRSRDAEELFARLRADPHYETACDEGSLLINQAWSRLLAREGGEEAEDPAPLLRKARDVFDREGCRPDQRLNARLNLVLAHQQAGRRREARQSLEEVRTLASAARLSQRLWWLDLEGREAIAEHAPARALHLYGELAALAARSRSLEGGFRAAVGRARARLSLGGRTAAIADLALADRLLDEQTWLIPADEGRDTFVAQREAATRLHLRLLLDARQPRRAFALARRARSRLLGQLAVRDRLAQLTPAEQKRWDLALSRYWTLRDAVDRQAAEEWQLSPDRVGGAREDRAAQLVQARKDLEAALAALGMPGPRGEDSLSPPRPGEVILAYHPLPQGWVGFAAHPRGVEVITFAMPPDLTDSAALSRTLLAPFRPLLDHAERLRVLPYGPLRLVDFHALPLGREPLLARHLVVYSLDLPSHPAAVSPGRPAALLVTDPEGNLPEARQEAVAVDAAIRTWPGGWSLTRLDGLAATAGKVRGALPGADLFHFAGHGNFAGFAGWDSALRLADGSRLTLGDLLALRRVPPWVVLSACEAGQSSGQSRGEGMGLAHAFLLAGSRSVIAATRPVDDRRARELFDELYRGWQPGADLSRQLQRAQLASRRRAPEADWASFRLLEP